MKWMLISGSITNKPTLAEGASVTPSSNMADNKVIRYQAVYASMTATVVENYEARNMKGAADLTWGWNMALSQPVFYKVYRDGTQISGSSGDNANLSYSAVVNTSGTQTGTYTVKTAGTYRLEAAGAKGGDNGSVKGGSGALVKGTIWLNEGDKIVYRTQNSSYAGGTGDTSGGAATTISLIRAGSSTEQLIMVAAGGGSATPTKTGGSATAITTATSTSHKGASGAYGGGEPGGNAGTYVVHHHTDDCYKTVDTSFVLMDRETDYLSPWAQSYLAYGQDMLGNGYRYNFANAGDYYDGRTNNYGIRHHGRDTASGGLIFLGRIHYAEEPHYRFFDIPVNGNKYLNLHLSSDYWGPTPNSQFNTSEVDLKAPAVHGPRKQ